jgi:hypothetical protein
MNFFAEKKMQNFAKNIAKNHINYFEFKFAQTYKNRSLMRQDGLQ